MVTDKSVDVVTTFKSSVVVSFKDEKLALRYFVQQRLGDQRERYSSIEEVGQQLAKGFLLANDFFRKSAQEFPDRRGELRRNVRGFGDFIYNYDTDTWHLAVDSFPSFLFRYGEVTIKLNNHHNQ